MSQGALRNLLQSPHPFGSALLPWPVLGMVSISVRVRCISNYKVHIPCIVTFHVLDLAL
jgi:hypothetical protein